MNGFKRCIIALLANILPQRVKNSLFHLSFNLAPSEFEKFAYEYGLAPHMERGLASIAKRGFDPKSIVDVGAFHGNWSRLAKRIWPMSRLVMVEANQSNEPHLIPVAKELGATLYFDLLGAKDGQPVQFNIMASGSSVLGERSAVPRTVEDRQLRRLDSLLEKIEAPGLLKIDAQGYELEILNGSLNVLPAFEAVLLEVSLIEINEGAPLLHEVTTFMKKNGFVAYDILEMHRRPLDKALNQIDIFFIRENSALIADKRHFS